MATHLVFLDPRVKIVKEKEQYLVRATEDISSGTLVLIEHAITGKSEEHIVAAMAHDDNLYKDLWPRSTFDVFPESVDEKMIKNMVYFSACQLVLGRFMAKFNHSCEPNCFLSCIDIVGSFYAIWTLKKIQKGQELFIDYVDGEDLDVLTNMMIFHGIHLLNGNGNEKVCGNEIDDIKLKNVKSKASKKSKIRLGLCQMWLERDKTEIEMKLDSYRGSPAFAQVCAVHEAMNNTAKLVVFQKNES